MKIKTKQWSAIERDRVLQINESIKHCSLHLQGKSPSSEKREQKKKIVCGEIYDYSISRSVDDL